MLINLMDAWAFLEESVTDIQGTFKAGITMFRNEAEKKHQHLNMEMTAAYPYVYVDASHFSEILMNILLPAIENQLRG